MKPGTTDPDFPDIPLGGWPGNIRDVDQRSAPPIYLIEWNQYTIDKPAVDEDTLLSYHLYLVAHPT